MSTPPPITMLLVAFYAYSTRATGQFDAQIPTPTATRGKRMEGIA